ncbi:hypothetical protein C8R46DRAFT_1035863 [Mycena filopes]|nr:hypothetical protein C8R46DRAFT_1035863 [Mycena filopes]
MRDRKGSRLFTNDEKNVYDGLMDAATNTELAVLAAYGQSISRPYLSQVRGAGSEDKNLLDLGPLHERVKAQCCAVIADPDLLLAPGASHVKGSMNGRVWDNPEIMYKIQTIEATLPRICESLVVFFTGALETWLRFSEDYAEGGTIANLTPKQRECAHMPTTNDRSEGTLGERRTGSWHAPNMTLHQHNARKMYKRNNTRCYRQRKAQQEFDTAAVEVKHKKDNVKAAKVVLVNAALDAKEPTNKEMDLQLAWHRRAEGPLPKGTESEIPKVSKLTSKALKRDTLVAAVHRFAARSSVPVVLGERLEEEQVEEDVDSDVDMELGY